MTRKATPLFAVVALSAGASIASANPETTTTRPRTLPSGAPACGNAQTKGPRRPCTDTASPSQAQPVVAPAAVPDRPRMLRTGAPACGNVLEKLDGNKSSVAYQYCINGIDSSAAVAGFMVVKKTLVLLGLREADPAPVIKAEPRRMRNGSPACGNVASRMAASVPSSSSRRNCNEID